LDKPLLEKLCVLDDLRAETKQLWGKMLAQHMVEHLIFAMRISNGKLTVECFNPPDKIPALRKFLMSSRPLPKEFINPIIGEGLVPLNYPDLKAAKKVLQQEVEDYYNYFKVSPEAVLTNPTFGKLDKTGWDVFHDKHFRHHFLQFGIKYD